MERNAELVESRIRPRLRNSAGTPRKYSRSDCPASLSARFADFLENCTLPRSAKMRKEITTPGTTLPTTIVRQLNTVRSDPITIGAGYQWVSAWPSVIGQTSRNDLRGAAGWSAVMAVIATPEVRS